MRLKDLEKKVFRFIDQVQVVDYSSQTLLKDKIQHMQARGIPQYIEVVSHEQRYLARDYLFLCDRILIAHGKDFTCPAKKLAIVAHYDDFEYD
jgi:hypothetical protein